MAAQLKIKQIILPHILVDSVSEGCAPQVWKDPIFFDMKINTVEPKSEIAHKSQTRKNSRGSRGIQTLVRSIKAAAWIFLLLSSQV